MKRLPGIVVAFVVLYTSIAIADERPTRSECIIGYNMDWSGVERHQNEIRNALGDMLIERIRIVELSGVSISDDGDEIYMQFRSSCEKKLQISNSLLKFWGNKATVLPEFTRIPDPIRPSTDTIDRNGRYWRD